MATTFKTFLNNDVTTTRTLLHEAIAITGAILSGTYSSGQGCDEDNGTYTTPVEYNIKNYSHGMFQSVFDYPHLSSSANHILDISVGLSSKSSMSGSTKGFATAQNGTAIGSGFGTIAIAGGGLTKTEDVGNNFFSRITVANGAIDDGNSIITIVTPLGTTITTTANDGTTTSAAVASGQTLAATFNSLANDTTLAAEVAASLDDHAEILATSAGAVVTIQFLSRAVDASDPVNRFIGTVTQQEKKIAMYNQMAQVLMGHDKDGNVRRFDADGNLGNDDDDKMDEVIFLNFSRLLVKDEIKKGSFQIKFSTEQAKATVDMSHADGIAHILTIGDTNAQNDFRINSPAGEYGILSASHTAFSSGGKQGMGSKLSTDRIAAGKSKFRAEQVGLIFYQAGVVVLTASIFNGCGDTSAAMGGGKGGGILNQAVSMSIGGAFNAHRIGVSAGQHDANINQMLTGSKIQNIANNIRERLYDVSFNNTTELNSTVYFCRANHNEFNYSANPTYLADSKIRVKDVPSDMPISYVTSIGLYSPDNELMATAKLSEPLRKDPTNELTLRVRLDY